MINPEFPKRSEGRRRGGGFSASAFQNQSLSRAGRLGPAQARLRLRPWPLGKLTMVLMMASDTSHVLLLSLGVMVALRWWLSSCKKSISNKIISKVIVKIKIKIFTSTWDASDTSRVLLSSLDIKMVVWQLYTISISKVKEKKDFRKCNRLNYRDTSTQLKSSLPSFLSLAAHLRHPGTRSIYLR